jgi:hypothetical protein
VSSQIKPEVLTQRFRGEGLTEQRIHETIQDLIQTGEFYQALDYLGEVEED